MTTPQPVAGADVLSRESQGSAVRLVDLIIDPPRAFQGIAHSAPWAAAFFTAVGLRFASLLVFYHPTTTIGKVVAGVVFQVGTVAPPLLFGSAIVWLAAKAAGLRVRWRVLFSIVAHLYVAYTLATIMVASIAGAILPESTEIDLRNPPFTNLVVLLGDSASEVARRLVAELDLRSAYVALLLWLGLRGAAPNESGGRLGRVVAMVAIARLVGVAAVQMLR